jgi:hypothetical protein
MSAWLSASPGAKTQQNPIRPNICENTAWYDATKVPCTPYNPVAARKLVAASGFSNQKPMSK